MYIEQDLYLASTNYDKQGFFLMFSELKLIRAEFSKELLIIV